MAEETEIVDGKLKITNTLGSTIKTLTRKEVVGKKAETQTKLDHLNIDLVEVKVELEKWNNWLEAIDEAAEVQ